MTAAAGRPQFLLSFLAWASGLSGGDRHLLDCASVWRREVDVTVVAPPEARETITSFLGDVPFVPLGQAGARAAGRGPALAVEYLRRAASVAVRPLSADVVVAASHFLPDAAALAAHTRRHALGVAYVYHLVADRADRSLRTLWSQADEACALRLVGRHARIVFASNTETERALARRGISTVRTDVGIDVARYGRRHGGRNGAPADGAFVARMVSTKGVLDAVEAWARVVLEVPGARLRMVGEGPARGVGERRAAELGIGDAVEWSGFVPEDEKLATLAGARVLLAPSYEEGWGIAVCEALASGTPVVAYRLATLDELFPDAYLGAPAGDVDALGSLAVQALRDDDLAERLASRGRHIAARYDVSRVAERELQTILRVLSEQR